MEQRTETINNFIHNAYVIGEKNRHHFLMIYVNFNLVPFNRQIILYLYITYFIHPKIKAVRMGINNLTF